MNPSRIPICGLLLAALLLAGGPRPASAHDTGEPHGGAAKAGGDAAELAEIGAKLSNPVSNVWALFTEFDTTFFDGDVNEGDAKVGSSMLFQPILPIPLFGEDWKLIVRPTVPVVWAQPRPDGIRGGVSSILRVGTQATFNYDTGLGDTLLPMLVSPPLGNWLVGVGPTFTIPTSTQDSLGRQQWAMGPAGVLGYKTKDWVAGVFPQYFWGIGSRGDQGDERDASYMSFLYFAFLNLPNAWQVGFNPSIAFDAKGSSGNKWNVPVGITVAKTVRMGKMPVKFQFGVEYSVVSQDDFGKRALIKLTVIPVIPSLIKRPLLGGS